MSVSFLPEIKNLSREYNLRFWWDGFGCDSQNEWNFAKPLHSCLQFTTDKYYHSQINYKLLNDKHHFGTWRSVAMCFAPASVNTLHLRSKPEKDEE